MGVKVAFGHSEVDYHFSPNGCTLVLSESTIEMHSIGVAIRGMAKSASMYRLSKSY